MKTGFGIRKRCRLDTGSQNGLRIPAADRTLRRCLIMKSTTFRTLLFVILLFPVYSLRLVAAVFEELVEHGFVISGWCGGHTCYANAHQTYNADGQTDPNVALLTNIAKPNIENRSVRNRTSRLRVEVAGEFRPELLGQNPDRIVREDLVFRLQCRFDVYPQTRRRGWRASRRNAVALVNSRSRSTTYRSPSMNGPYASESAYFS